MSLPSFSQEIFGLWQTIDDNTSEPRSIVEIYEKDGKAYGRIVEVLPRPDLPENPICVNCSGEDKDRPITGMNIIRQLEKDGDEWEDGTILDPENGKTYDCKLWVEDGKLMVRGYIAFFFRTQVWLPVEG